MIVIRGFNNLSELNHYRQVMASSDDFRLPPGVRPVAISAANFEKMINEGRTFDDYFRYLEEQNYVDAQAGILAPDEIETLDEADRAEADTDVPAPVTEEVETPRDASVPEPKTQATRPEPKPAAPAPVKTPDPDLGSEGDDPLLDD